MPLNPKRAKSALVVDPLSRAIDKLHSIFCARRDHMQWIGIYAGSRWHGSTQVWWKDYFTGEYAPLGTFTEANLLPSLEAVLDEAKLLRSAVDRKPAQPATTYSPHRKPHGRRQHAS